MSTRLSVVLILVAACDMPTTTCEPADAIEAIDLNNDGRPDVRKFTANGREVCRESDLDFDGRPDTITVSDANTTWIGMDLDGDGRCDRIEVQAGGKPTHELLDVDHDGRIDHHRPL